MTQGEDEFAVMGRSGSEEAAEPEQRDEQEDDERRIHGSLIEERRPVGKTGLAKPGVTGSSTKTFSNH